MRDKRTFPELIAAYDRGPVDDDAVNLLNEVMALIRCLNPGDLLYGLGDVAGSFTCDEADALQAWLNAWGVDTDREFLDLHAESDTEPGDRHARRAT